MILTAAGVASLGGAEAAVAMFRAATSTNLREWIAADVAVMTGEPLDQVQSQLVTDLEREGVDSTMTIEAVAQATSERVPSPQVVMARVVDPRKYPYYGLVRFSPDLECSRALSDDAVAVSEELMERLEARVGGRIEVNGAPLTVSAVIRSVPDQLALIPTPLPRILLSRGAAIQTGLLRWHGIHYERVLLRLSRDDLLPSVRSRVEAAFPGRRVLDYRRPDPLVALTADRAEGFLRLISVLALLVGALSMALAVWLHLDRRMDAIAIKKVLGASSHQILAIYGWEILLLTGTGSLLGMVSAMVVGWVIVAALPSLFSVQLEWSWNWSGPARGVLMGMLSALAVMGPVIVKVRAVRPHVLLRRRMADGDTMARGRFHAGPITFSTGSVFLFIAAVQPSWRNGLTLFVAMAGLTALISLLSAVALHGLNAAYKRLPPWQAVRHGIRFLLRPGGHARAGIGVMSAGVALVLTVQLLARSALDDLSESVPPTGARLLLMNVQPDQLTGLAALLSSTPGITRRPIILPFYVASVVAVEGRPIGDLPSAGPAGLERRWLAAGVDPDSGVVDLVDGQWWSKNEREAKVALPRSVARAMGARLGSRVEFLAGGSRFSAQVAALFSSGGLDRLRCCFLFNRVVREPENVIYHGFAAVPPERTAAVRELIYRNFPTVTTIDGAGGIHLFERWIDSVLWLVRMAAALTMASAAVLAGASIAANMESRAAEVAIWRVLGARTGSLLWAHFAEFTTMGVTAGVISILLATLAAAPAWAWFTDRDFRWPSVWVLLLALCASVVIANVAGWLVVWRAVSRKPLETIRDS